MPIAARILALASLPLCIWPDDGIGKTRADSPRVIASYANLPLSFEANRGQTDRRVKFLSRGRGHTLFLTDREAVLALQKPSHDPTVLRLKLAGASAATTVSGMEELPGKSNYFIGLPSGTRRFPPTPRFTTRSRIRESI